MRKLLIAFALIAISTTATARAQSQDLKLWYDKPADPKVWEEALPIGNGRMGAMVFGGTADERIQFNEDTLWTGKPHDYVRAGARESLDEIRRLVFEGKVKEAGELVRKSFLSDPVRQKAYQPFGDLIFKFPGHENVTEYRRDLDLDTATARVAYQVNGVTFRREVFASYPANAILVRLSADRANSVSFRVKMTSPHKTATTKPVSQDTISMTGQVLDPTVKDPNEQPGLKFESRLQIKANGGKTSVSEDGIGVEGANNVLLTLVAATSYNNYAEIGADPEDRCVAMLKEIATQSYETIRKRHLEAHQFLFRRVTLDVGRTDRADLPTDQRLAKVGKAANPSGAGGKNPPLPESLSADGLDADPALAALYFQMGRYMLITSSRPGSQPANLQGVWNKELSPPWESKYTTNINLEMNYWPSEVTNLTECNEPLWTMISELTVTGAQTAKEQYGARGWVLHHNTDHWRGTAPINNVDGVWPTGGAWLCHHLWDHWLFTGDKDFLRDRAYPVMRDCSLFFIDTLVKDPHTSFLVTNPSFSPEQGELCAGPAMDMQLIRAVFDYTSEAAGILKMDPELVSQIAEVRKQLAPDKIGKHGQLQEWQEDVDQPNNNHRHMSPLWGLFPGAQFTPNTPKLYEAAKLLLKWRGDGSTGWSFAWRMPLWARVYDGDYAYRQLYLQLAKRTFPNLFDKCGPFQVDGDFGACAGIAEMLLQSHIRIAAEDGTMIHRIDLLPALPKAWPTGIVTGLRARGGFEVDMSWENGKLTRAVVRSTNGNACKLHTGSKTIDLKTETGKSYAFDGDLQTPR
jgi:alpha-L-fucosidase 2